MPKERRRGPTPDEVAILYNLIGKAVWHLQFLEDAISVAITLKSDLKDAKPGSVPADEVMKVRTKRQRMTLGQAVEHAKRTALFPRRFFRSSKSCLAHETGSSIARRMRIATP